ncbi:MAG: phasin family protein [Pseudomonadota bacterium]
MNDNKKTNSTNNEKAFNQAFEQGKKTLEQVASATREQASKASENAIKNYSEMVSSSRDNIEVMLHARQTFINGLEDISKDVFALAQSASEQQVEFTKKMASSQSITDVANNNANYIRSSLDSWYNEAQRLSNKFYKLGLETAAPLENKARENMQILSKNA